MPAPRFLLQFPPPHHTHTYKQQHHTHKPPPRFPCSCCGMMFNSRGFKDAAAKKGSELEAALLKASENGKWPVVCDTSPCLAQIKSGLSDPALR